MYKRVIMPSVVTVALFALSFYIQLDNVFGDILPLITLVLATIINYKLLQKGDSPSPIVVAIFATLFSFGWLRAIDFFSLWSHIFFFAVIPLFAFYSGDLLSKQKRAVQIPVVISLLVVSHVLYALIALHNNRLHYQSVYWQNHSSHRIITLS